MRYRRNQGEKPLKKGPEPVQTNRTTSIGPKCEIVGIPTSAHARSGWARCGKCSQRRVGPDAFNPDKNETFYDLHPSVSVDRLTAKDLRLNRWLSPVLNDRGVHQDALLKSEQIAAVAIFGKGTKAIIAQTADIIGIVVKHAIP
jgi:hypothetical protein